MNPLVGCGQSTNRALTEDIGPYCTTHEIPSEMSQHGAYGLIRRHLAVRLNAMLQAEELPAPERSAGKTPELQLLNEENVDKPWDS